MEKYMNEQLTKEQMLIEAMLFKKLKIIYRWETNTICHNVYNSKYGGDLDQMILSGKVRVTVFSKN